MASHRDLFRSIKKSPGMFVIGESYAEVAALVLGYDLACEGGLLVGFREWLVLRSGTGSNLAWIALALSAAFPESSDPEAELRKSTDAERHAIAVLVDLIEEFDNAREGPDGLLRIFSDYERWLKKHRLS